MEDDEFNAEVMKELLTEVGIDVEIAPNGRNGISRLKEREAGYYSIVCLLYTSSRMLLDSHIRTCVVNDIKNGDETVVDELIETVNRFMK